MKANDEAKNILSGRTCDECNYFRKEWNDTYYMGEDEVYTNYCTLIHESVHPHHNCRDWSKFDPKKISVLSQAEIDQLLRAMYQPLTKAADKVEKGHYIDTLTEEELDDYKKQIGLKNHPTQNNVLSQEDIDVLLRAITGNNSAKPSDE